MFKPEDHALILTGPIEFSRGMIGGECSCSNPDGEGTGGVSFMEHTVDMVFEAWLEHYYDMQDRAEEDKNA